MGVKGFGNAFLGVVGDFGGVEGDFGSEMSFFIVNLKGMFILEDF